MSLLTKHGLFEKQRRRFKEVLLPGSGDTARIRSLTTGEMRQLRSSLVDKKGELIRKRGDRLSQLLIAACLVDDQGNRVLTDDDAMSDAFDSVDGATVSMLFAECKQWTGFGSDTDWSAIEDSAKNSEETSSSST